MVKRIYIQGDVGDPMNLRIYDAGTGLTGGFMHPCSKGCTP
jgi:hypothetical protein